MRPVAVGLLFAIAGLGLSACDNTQRTTLESSNIALVSQVFTEQLNRGNWDLAERIHAPDFVAHAGTSSAGWPEDLEASKSWRVAFPDLRMTIEDTFAEKDYVTVRWSATGTNTGKGNGLPATGRQIRVSGITIFRVSSGRIAEEWNETDELTMMRQLGLFPDPGRNASSSAK
jgi:steroid delta-isomerase-like uncharacterized protein